MIFEKTAALIAEKNEIDISTITPETKFEDLEIDSLDIAELAMKLEDEFNITLEIDASLKTVGDLTAKIEEAVNGK